MLVFSSAISLISLHDYFFGELQLDIQSSSQGQLIVEPVVSSESTFNVCGLKCSKSCNSSCFVLVLLDMIF